MISKVRIDGASWPLHVGTMENQPRHHARLERHRTMSATYGFGLFPLPAYRDAEVRGARIVRHLPSLADGYLRGTTLEHGRHVLYVDGTAWMSTGLMEQESHAFHVQEARGIVVAAGLGMGMYAFSASLKPEVEQLVAIECHPGVIAAMKAAAGFAGWPGRSKVTILETDALGPDLASQLDAVTGSRRPDYLFADLWPTCASPHAPRETAAIVRALRPKAAGWRGQELSFGLWCRTEMRQADQAALEQYFASVAVPVQVTPAYAAFCNDVIAANLPTAPGWRGVLRRILRTPGGKRSVLPCRVRGAATFQVRRLPLIAIGRGPHVPTGSAFGWCVRPHLRAPRADSAALAEQSNRGTEAEVGCDS